MIEITKQKKMNNKTKKYQPSSLYNCQNVHTIQNIPGHHHHNHHWYSKITESVTIEIDVLAFFPLFFFVAFADTKKG